VKHLSPYDFRAGRAIVFNALIEEPAARLNLSLAFLPLSKIENIGTSCVGQNHAAAALPHLGLR
jgi:hypothetical protein